MKPYIFIVSLFVLNLWCMDHNEVGDEQTKLFAACYELNKLMRSMVDQAKEDGILQTGVLPDPDNFSPKPSEYTTENGVLIVWQNNGRIRLLTPWGPIHLVSYISDNKSIIMRNIAKKVFLTKLEDEKQELTGTIYYVDKIDRLQLPRATLHRKPHTEDDDAERMRAWRLTQKKYE